MRAWTGKAILRTQAAACIEVIMGRVVLCLTLIFTALLLTETARAEQPICHDFLSKIEPGMQRQEIDFTAENYNRAQQMLDETIPNWMEKRFAQNKNFQEAYDKLIQGDLWLAHAYATAGSKDMC